MKKGNIMALLGMAAMGGLGSMGGYPLSQERSTPIKKYSRPRLSGLKYIGDIPYGCKLVNVTVSVEIGGKTLEVHAQIVAATNKAFNKKLTKLSKEVEFYLNCSSEKEIEEDGYVTTTPNQVIDVKEVENV